MSHEPANHRDLLSTIAGWAMFSRDLEPQFPLPVLQQVASFEGPALESGVGIRELTAVPWCSTDNDDSRDLDQLTAAESLADGQTRVFVAVADVGALVKIGSPIDEHARANTTSVYTSARVFQMLAASAEMNAPLS